MVGQFRVHTYFDPAFKVGDSFTENAATIYSGGFNKIEDANALFENLMKLPGFTGGNIEQDLGGRLGWCIADEVETVQYLHRMREDDGEPVYGS